MDSSYPPSTGTTTHPPSHSATHPFAHAPTCNCPSPHADTGEALDLAPGASPVSAEWDCKVDMTGLADSGTSLPSAWSFDLVTGRWLQSNNQVELDGTALPTPGSPEATAYALESEQGQLQ